MKTLYLLRHAKSSWKKPQLADMERNLNSRGKTDAPFMGEKLKEQGILPDLIIASPAKRTAKTARTVAAKLGYKPLEIVYETFVYDATALELLQLIQQVPANIGSLMLVGHNPGLTELSNTLCTTDVYNIPTCGVRCIRFPTNKWSELREKQGTEVFFDYPKRYL